ncbi:hypothetical protein COM06_20020 [Bacillus toyonensis]|uniref:hypothetical protein n=1 Tax=Bacillus toyonensis TaxID=155322 RepID=UPI000BF808A0|nr:hypothetical protein [Bacillus toyonensis]PGB24787.1 hypothetical protein COM06_20020 [Bacillus toyonensis]
MGFKAEVLRVLIASPSDVQQERDEIERVIFEWNIRYSEELNIILLPSRWENDVVPTYGGMDAQQVINEQLVNKCDILIGVFWTKLGTPTTRHSSGTLEEISIFIEKEREVMLYFVDRNIPRNSNLEEIQRVDSYRSEYGKKGVYAPYDIHRIRDHLYKKALTHKTKSEGIMNQNHAPQKINGISLESLIKSSVLSIKELILFKYIIDTENRHFGSEWNSKETIQKLRTWESQKELTCELWQNYSEVIANFIERGLLEEKEFHYNEGYVLTYALPLQLFDQIRSLSVESKEIIETAVLSQTFKWPF